MLIGNTWVSRLTEAEGWASVLGVQPQRTQLWWDCSLEVERTCVCVGGVGVLLSPQLAVEQFPPCRGSRAGGGSCWQVLTLCECGGSVTSVPGEAGLRVAFTLPFLKQTGD